MRCFSTLLNSCLSLLSAFSCSCKNPDRIECLESLFGIEQQKPPFQILDPATASVGVHLSPSLMMVTRKSVSGVLAATPQEYIARAHCPRQSESRSTPLRWQVSANQACRPEVFGFRRCCRRFVRTISATHTRMVQFSVHCPH